MSGRFDYIKYDEKANQLQALFKITFENLAKAIESLRGVSRPQFIALTKLEECYMWTGKAIRDDQIARVGTAVSLNEERDPSPLPPDQL